MKPLSFAPALAASASLALLASCPPLAAQAAESAAPAATNPKTDSEAVPHFDIWEYRVFGNTVLDPNTVQKTVYPYLGPGRSLDDVEKARQKLEEVYHQAGYQTVLVNVPEQDVENGLVKLDVTEGKVERLKVSGSRYYSLGHIREGVPSLAAGQVPHMPSVQKQLSELANQSADRQITPVLRTGERPGTFDAELKVKDELPIHGSLEMNGRNTAGTTYSRLLATLRYDNLWQLNHSASLQYLVAPESQDVEVWSGTYALPLFDSSTRLAFYGVGVSSSSVVAASGDLGVLGAGEIFGVRLSKTLEPIDGYFHSLTAGVDYKHYTQPVNPNATKVQVPLPPITYLPFTVGYSGGLRREDSLTNFNMEGHFAIEGLVTDPTQFEQRRYHAQPNFFYFTGGFRHQHKLPWDLGVVLRAAGQVADGPLINYEQFSAGGAYSVRGYHETQELADNGVSGSLELYSPRLVPDDWENTKDFRLLAFVDGAELWLLDNVTPTTPSHSSLASTGLGLRMEFWKRVIGELDWAYPLVRSTTTGATGSVAPGNQRIHFRLAYEF
jgi:hemolysin activation/secretion protein